MIMEDAGPAWSLWSPGCSNMLGTLNCA